MDPKEGFGTSAPTNNSVAIVGGGDLGPDGRRPTAAATAEPASWGDAVAPEVSEPPSQQTVGVVNVDGDGESQSEQREHARNMASRQKYHLNALVIGALEGIFSILNAVWADAFELEDPRDLVFSVSAIME